VRLPEVSTAILDKKLASVEASGADCVVACDAGCLMQMRGGLSRRASRVQALHLAEVLEVENHLPEGSGEPFQGSPST